MSNNTKHTPGPWRIRPSSGGRPAIVYGNDGWPVGDVTAFHGRVSQEQQDANAKLIAAAPNCWLRCKAWRRRTAALGRR